ncbi:MAG: universal stress protein [Chloroflexi bacterium]|nr:universal stress protein [Chloroflexota bacterium]
MARFRSILAPVVDDSASLEAVAIGASLARQEKGVLTLLHVIEVERSLPVTADMDLEAQSGEELLRRARALAAEAGNITINDELLQARVAGPAIVEEAEARGVDVIMMGVGWSPLLGQFEVGPTAGYVLRHASCNVWIVREPLEMATAAAGKAAASR